jgi:hypothetical protein
MRIEVQLRSIQPHRRGAHRRRGSFGFGRCGGHGGTMWLDLPITVNPGCYDQSAGWSSQVARWAHNPKVASSNLAPATNILKRLRACRKTKRLPLAPSSAITAFLPLLRWIGALQHRFPQLCYEPALGVRHGLAVLAASMRLGSRVRRCRSPTSSKDSSIESSSVSVFPVRMVRTRGSSWFESYHFKRHPWHTAQSDEFLACRFVDPCC